MKFFLLSLFLSLCSTICFPQRAQHIMVAVHADLIKSDNDGFFEKMQAAIEGSYYFSRKFAATVSAEWWSDDQTVVALGGRFCPIDEAFVRIRALPREDFSIGGGFAKPLSDNLRLEAMADFYFHGHIAIRAGLSYGIGGRP